MYVSCSQKCDKEDLHLTLLHSERPKLYTILAFLSAVGLILCTQKGQNAEEFWPCIQFWPF